MNGRRTCPSPVTDESEELFSFSGEFFVPLMEVCAFKELFLFDELLF